MGEACSDIADELKLLNDHHHHLGVLPLQRVEQSTSFTEKIINKILDRDY